MNSFCATTILILSVFSAKGLAENLFIVGSTNPNVKDSYVLRLDKPEDIAHARNLIEHSPSIGGTIIVARIQAVSDGVNKDYQSPGAPRWNWSITEFLGFADVTQEALDGGPALLSANPQGWIDGPTHGKIGFWSYTIVRELKSTPKIRINQIDGNQIRFELSSLELGTEAKIWTSNRLNSNWSVLDTFEVNSKTMKRMIKLSDLEPAYFFSVSTN